MTPAAHALHRLATLQGLAEQQEQQAARQLAEALARHAMAQDRHAELLQYEAEYANRPPQATGVAALSQQAAFLERLRTALRFQAERAAAMGGELEQARQRWVALHREVEKLEQLATIARRQMAAEEARRQSRELDELAQSGWLRQQAVGG